MTKQLQYWVSGFGVVIGLVGIGLTLFQLYDAFRSNVTAFFVAFASSLTNYGIIFSYVVWMLFLTIYASIIFYERVNGRNLAQTKGTLDTKNYPYTLWVWGGLALVTQHATLMLDEAKPLIVGYSWAIWISSLITAMYGFYWLVGGRVYINGYWTAHIYRYEEQRLISSGAYSRIRHPIYCGQIYITIAIWIACNNLWLTFFPVMTFGYSWMRAAREEKELDRILAGLYSEYKKTCPNFLFHPLL